jgi:predicted RNA-binding protein associated with RNAse of E/G family
MNDTEREQWVDNDEGLYDLMRSSGLSKRRFIREWRAEIDAVIAAVTDGRKPAHFLKYGG